MTAISTYVESGFYILGMDGQPLKAGNEAEYMSWHNRLPDILKTTKGLSLGRAENKKYIISTVFLGKAHGYDDESKLPILWESVVINLATGKRDEFRYLTEEDATLGHNSLCEELMPEVLKSDYLIED